MVRVMSIPGRTHENRFFRLLLDAVEEAGAAVVSPTARNAVGLRFDVLIINFPTHYITENNALKAALSSVSLGSFLVLSRLLGRRIVYIVHDVIPFRQRHTWLLRPMLRLAHGLTSGFVFLSQSSRAAFLRLYPGFDQVPWILAPHGPYPTVVASDAERLRLRTELFGEAQSFTLGFLGNIKPYKNIDALRSLPATLPDGRAIKVLVAGRVEQGHVADAEAALASLPPGQVVRIDQRLSDERFDALIQAVDAILLPYTKGSNSGVALLVLSNHSRLIGSGLPVFQELAQAVGAPWAYATGKDHLTLADAVMACAADQVSAADREALDGYLASVSFTNAGVDVLMLISRLK